MVKHSSEMNARSQKHHFFKRDGKLSLLFTLGQLERFYFTLLTIIILAGVLKTWKNMCVTI